MIYVRRIKLWWDLLCPKCGEISPFVPCSEVMLSSDPNKTFPFLSNFSKFQNYLELVNNGNVCLKMFIYILNEIFMLQKQA